MQTTSESGKADLKHRLLNVGSSLNADIHQGDGYVRSVTSRQPEFHTPRLRRLAQERELTEINICA